jgi:4-hydroxybenzoate polyprenyltransferase
MVVNDKEDEQSDRITNPNRILPRSLIEVKQYLHIGYFALGGALFLSAAIGLEAFFLIALGNTLYTAYSVPPFLFKRNFVLSKVAIAIATILVMTSGYLLNTTGCSAFLPTSIILALFLAVFLAANVIDLKDTAGDKTAGVRTLPVRIGDRAARLVIALLILLGFVSLPYILNVRSGLAGAVLLGFLTGASLFLRPYKEWVTFGCFVITLAYFSALFLGLF